MTARVGFFESSHEPLGCFYFVEVPAPLQSNSAVVRYSRKEIAYDTCNRGPRWAPIIRIADKHFGMHFVVNNSLEIQLKETIVLNCGLIRLLSLLKSQERPHTSLPEK